MAANIPFRVDPGDRALVARKDALRARLSFQRQTINEDLKNTTRWKVINHLRTLHSEISPGVVALYMPLRDEIDLTPWARELWENGETVALPRVVERGHPLVFNIWMPGTKLDIDRLGIACANGPEIMPAMMVIPALGYNRRGYRLGYGGGYYDMTLKMMDRPILTAGIAYTELEVEDFPAQYHDQRLQYFVTGKEVIPCG
jgi:5-formyltetrahydrofolate cyclo-ligase